MLVTAPFVLLLIDYWPLGRIRRGDGAAHPDVGRLRAAIAQYSTAIELYPRWAAAHLGRAGCSVRLGDLEATAESYQRALDIQPDQPAVRADLGVLLVEIGRVDEGLRELDCPTREGEASADVLAFLADRSLARGRPDEAVGYYRKAIRRDADHATATNNPAWLLATSRDPSLRDPEEAVAQAERAVRLLGSDPRALDTLAAAYAAAGRYDDAVRTAASARKEIPDGSPQALQLDSRLELYRSGRAAHEQGPGPAAEIQVESDTILWKIGTDRQNRPKSPQAGCRPFCPSGFDKERIGRRIDVELPRRMMENHRRPIGRGSVARRGPGFGSVDPRLAIRA